MLHQQTSPRGKRNVSEEPWTLKVGGPKAGELCKEAIFEENIKELGQRGGKTSLPGKEIQFKGLKVC